jgi:NAD(P)-dependent dehydrogenase (short-subunit alcohol dehydrogenase family)
VTGAGQGLDEAMALALAEAGATVALLAREEAKAAEVANRIRANGGGGALFVFGCGGFHDRDGPRHRRWLDGAVNDALINDADCDGAEIWLGCRDEPTRIYAMHLIAGGDRGSVGERTLGGGQRPRSVV